MQSTQRVKSINAVVHKAVASSSSMADVVEALDSRIKINNEIKKYFSSQIVKEIHKQICESILYRCERIDINETFAFDDNQLVYLKALLKLTSKGSIRKIWRIIPYMTTKTYQHIIILNDANGRKSGCCIHILLMSARWLQDNAWENIESI
ncbi:hypothetical protein RhiirC2_779672 [Rhizophagus irregularis]|uniref:Uncharacterized protein n=1 Tax=Rhizophagus irregularis TaxID=588596 RepID=A0A2N1N9A7_9GLOM|nr:hypothetical protein RhiirC2_779672 [Rhizophagus irregularis]